MGNRVDGRAARAGVISDPASVRRIAIALLEISRSTAPAFVAASRATAVLSNRLVSPRADSLPLTSAHA